MRFRSALLLASLALISGCLGDDSSQPSIPAQETFAASLGIDLSTFTKISDDLYYKDIVVGGGATALQNKLIIATYSGFLKDGTTFGSNQTTGERQLNDSNFIPGWVLGIPGMKVGGTRKLVIGSSYAYGANGVGSIPPHTTLIFNIELTSVR